MQFALLTLAALFAPAEPPVLQDTSPAQDLAAALTWREIGPSVFSGRIVDLAVRHDQPSTILVASGSGGLWRTTNHGTTWNCIFQDEAVISIGAIAWDPTDANVIWVGSGEANNQRSSYWGDGVYRTGDGGETWTNMGLPDSHHIARIVIDPEDPNIVFVAALGHLYTPNAERGLYRTTDGGATWDLVLDAGEDVGVVDVLIDPNDRTLVYAATYERRRRAWDFDGNGPGSGIWRSNDSGVTFTRIEGGLPTGDIARIGLDAHKGEATTLFATVANQNMEIVEVENPPEGDVALETRFEGGQLIVVTVTEGGGPAELGLQPDDVLVSLGETRLASAWAWLGALSALKGGQEATLVVDRGDETLELTATPALLARTLPVEPREREIGGQVYRSTDSGETWELRNEKPVGGDPPYYYGQIRVDPNDVDQLYLVGVPLYESKDGGVTWESNVARSLHVDHHALRIDPADSNKLYLGNDGGLGISYDKGATWDHFDNLPLAQFYAVAVDDQQPYRVYGGTQDNGTWSGPSVSRDRRGIGRAEWERVGGGDGFYAQIDPEDANTVYAEWQFGNLYRRDLATGGMQMIKPRAPEGEKPYRFNWNSPILLSRHNPRTLYFGGERFFKSLDRGDSWTLISDDLTTADPDKLSGNVPHCTLTCIDESHFDPYTLMVGSDDGLVHRTRDGGHTWTNLTGRLPGAPANWWVSRIVMSDHVPERAYVTMTGYREDDFRPLLWRTDDLGETWKNLSAGLPQEPVNVVREDPRSADLLYAGTELGCYMSFDAGRSWSDLGAGLPTVAVHDLTIQARENELVVATHGRGFWVVDIAPLIDLDADEFEKPSTLFAVRDVTRWDRTSLTNASGDRQFFGSNGPRGATIRYRLVDGLTEAHVECHIEDAKGEVTHTFEEPPHTAGVHTLQWGGGRGGRAGAYTVVLRVQDQESRQSFRIVADPGATD